MQPAPGELPKPRGQSRQSIPPIARRPQRSVLEAGSAAAARLEQRRCEAANRRRGEEAPKQAETADRKENNAMLMPKKVKYRKQQRGRMTGKAWRGSSLSFGEFGLKAMSAAGSPTGRSKRPVSR